MKNARKIMAIALVGVFAFAPLFIPSGASACSCIMQPDLNEEAVKSSSAIFAGRFVSSAPEENGKALTFEVSKTWKGPNTRTIVVHTADNSAACGWDPEANKEYLVYASTYEEPIETGKAGDLHVGLCNRVFALADAENDLANLGEGKVPPPAEAPATEPVASNGSSTAVYVALGVVLLVVVIATTRKSKGNR